MKIIFVIFLLPLRLLAQDITGVWTGTLYNDTTKQYLRYELAISKYNGKLSGYSHTIFVIDSVENIGVKSIKVKKSGDDYFIEDDKLIYNNYTEPPAKGVKTYSELQLSETDSSMILKGSWKTNATKTYRSITGNILLKKKKKIEETLIIPKLQNLGLAKLLSFMPYDNYSKDIAITNMPVDNRSFSIKQNQSVETNNSSNNIVNSNSPEKKEIESKVSPLSADARQEATVNKSILNSSSNKIPEKDITKNNSPIDAQAANASEKKEAQIKVKKTSEHTNSNITYAPDQKNQPDNKIIKAATGLNKNIDKTASNNQVVITPNDVSKVSSINMGVNNVEIKEKKEQINPVKTLVRNYAAINSNINQVSKAAADISSRKIETVQSVEIKSDSLMLTLYDNGVVDGDTVSVLLNGKVIMPMEGLSLKAINKTIYLTPEMGDSIVLIMYAENLGSIPPNTGLLVVHDGNDIYEIRFSGDLQKNAAIILKRKKKK